MKNAFSEGGWGMYPTTLFGLCLIATALIYAIRPERRFVPLQLSLGLMTVAAGTLGFVTGVIRSLDGLRNVPSDHQWIWLRGLGESLNNLGMALTLIVLAIFVASIGTLRIAFGQPKTG